MRDNRKESFLAELMKRFFNDDVTGMSAELAYFFLLSLFPFLIFLITLFGFLPLSEEDVLSFLAQYAPEGTMLMIENILSQVLNTQNGGLLSFGILATIWSASNGIHSIVRALNKAFEVSESRSFFAARGISILLTFAMVFVIIVALLLPVFGHEIGLFIFSLFGFSELFFHLWNAIRWVLSALILFVVFAALYLFAPNKHLLLKHVLPGAAFSTIGWIAASAIFSYFVTSFANFSAMYGSIGGIIILMIWFYITGMMIILGGELNAAFYKRHSAK
ncbi:YihY family inner membrane protein [Bacillus lacus]|uniref:YihY family inner membrane protein n=1 Tax=Metabacillus lacus TaxID=1983721 RepID=A0A7X2J151_9BACI|nr:YihY/virulence factor BrkB family protein [Metabacillus lacus]MRX73359.1 YihY family inner membrane protein [Metabacillus lacus]